MKNIRDGTFRSLQTFDLKNGYETGKSFIVKLELADYASNLGGVSSAVMQPATLFGGRLPEHVVKKQGLTPGLIRFAVGMENTDDLISDIDQALSA